MDDAQFRQLLDRFDFSWEGYRRVRKGVKKRLVRHMQEIGCRNIGEYIAATERDHGLWLRFICLMTVSISRFFRDRGLWQALQERILPVLAEKSNRRVRVWSAGCAAGEEPYSLKISWEGMRRTSSYLPDLSILATDLCPECLERAKMAVYHQKSLREVPDSVRSDFFERVPGEKYALKTCVKEGISWHVHDLLSDPPGPMFDLVFLRNNLLTYYRHQISGPAFAKILDTLAPGGYLIIGRHERMPFDPPDLQPWNGIGYVFQKRHGPD